MSTTVGDARVTITGDATGLTDTFDEVADKADGNAKKVSSGFSAEFNKISSAGAAMAAGLGGPFGKIASLSNAALKPLTEVASGLGGITGQLALVGGGAALAVAAFAGVGFAAKGIADAAVEAAGRLDDLGIAVDAESKSQLDAYAAASQDVSVALDQLTVSVGADLAGGITTIVRAVAGGIVEFTAWRESIAEDVAAIQELTREVVNFASFGLSESLIGKVDAYADATDRATVAVDGLTAAVIFGGSADDEEALRREAARLARDRESAATRAAAVALVEQAAAQKEATRAAAEYVDLIGLREAMGEAHQIHEVTTAIDEETAALGDLRMAMADAHQEADSLGQAQEANAGKGLAASVSAAAGIANAFGSAGTQILGSLQQVERATLASFDARLSAGETLSDAEVKMANAAQNRMEAEAIVTAGIQATLAGLGMISALAPSMGPWAIPVGITIAGGLFAASVAAIESAQPLDYSYSVGGASGSGGNSGSEGNTGVLGDTDNDGIPDDNSKPSIDTGSDSGRNSRSRGGGGGTLTLDPRLNRLRITSDSRVGKRTR